MQNLFLPLSFDPLRLAAMSMFLAVFVGVVGVDFTVQLQQNYG